jgi:hypothetical protein
MQYTHKGLGVKFGGRCLICGKDTGSRDWERALTALYKSEAGKFAPVHPECAGGRTKNAVGGGAKYSTEPAETLDI